MYFDTVAFIDHLRKLKSVCRQAFCYSIAWIIITDFDQYFEFADFADEADSPFNLFKKRREWYMQMISNTLDVFTSFQPKSLLGMPWKITLGILTFGWSMLLIIWFAVRTVIGHLTKAVLLSCLACIWVLIALLASAKIGMRPAAT